MHTISAGHAQRLEHTVPLISSVMVSPLIDRG